MAESIRTHRLGLFGHPVKHSQSPKIHQGFAAQFGIELDYELMDVTAAELPEAFALWISQAQGCNITVPHKTNIMPLLDHYTEKAHLAQAVNTVFWREGQLWGDNTDGDGLIMDLKTKGMLLQGARVLIIGAGGATQGIIPSLLEQGVDEIQIINRNQQKAEKLAAQFDRCSNFEVATDAPFDLIIHATSMGHQGLCPDLDPSWFDQNSMAYDLSYGAAAQPFLFAAQETGACVVYDGLGMLYGQAALAFNIWFAKKPEITLT
ncbi:shikimate dehydrogenase [Marinicella sp. S1101]|uniref:shikimate dehydrogenase n=1 Tax=Marinicella marina TaxID=2996016 RepID=UPI002260FBED|nr:shikimate dehydrogenase [Marinicella marina]MCX7552957.1 shikimate dehydrogenase [Marinicella marina]MDJ1139733.1 shikimate dehydrogenase [Marinicella marina]